MNLLLIFGIFLVIQMLVIADSSTDTDIIDLNTIELDQLVSDKLINVGENATFTASLYLNQTNLVAPELLAANKCQVPEMAFPLNWRVPSPLQANSARSRVWVTTWCEIVDAKYPLVGFLAKLELIDVGYRHSVAYIANSMYAFNQQAVRLTVRPPISGAFHCNYGDQCHNGFCDHSTGQCDQCPAKQVYDKDRRNCLERRSVNETCAIDKQCFFSEQEVDMNLSKHNLTQPICNPQGVCHCAGDTVANILSTPEKPPKPFVCLNTIASVADNQLCISNAQCLATNSMCGNDLSDVNFKGLRCRCRTGYVVADNAHHCRPIRTCSRADYNSQEVPGNGCDEHQFCRLGVCQCSTYYRFDAAGVCRPYGPRANSNWFEDNIIYISAFIIIVIAGFFAVICLSIRQCIYRQRTKTPTPTITTQAANPIATTTL